MRSLSSIHPIILAAGDSTRMGYPKALLPIGKETFLKRILRIVQHAGLGVPTIILGRAADVIRPTVDNPAVRIRINPDPDRGQLSSIQIGLSSLDSTAQAAMLWPVDQPGISEDLVRNLAERFIQSESLIAYPRRGEKRGHPAIFHRDLFLEFMGTPLDEGPKEILVRHSGHTLVLPTEELAAVHDIDTPSDYEILTGVSLERALARKQ